MKIARTDFARDLEGVDSLKVGVGTLARLQSTIGARKRIWVARTLDGA